MTTTPNRWRVFAGKRMMSTNCERYLRGEISTGCLIHIENVRDVVGQLANIVDELKRELQRAVELLDGECTKPDGSNADTTSAHALIQRLTEQPEVDDV